MTQPVHLSAQWQADEGLSRSEYRRLLARGDLVALRRGVCAIAESLSPAATHLRLARAVALQRAGPVFSHATAALALGLPVDAASLGRVRVIREVGHAQLLRDVHETQGPLRPGDVTVVGGLRVTSVPRTVIDLARDCPLEWGVVAADAALHKGLCSHDDLVRAVGEAKGRRGVHRARRAITFADGAAESPLESVSRVAIHRASIPKPILQHPVLLSGSVVARGDFAWPDFHVIGECDGAAKYTDLLAPGQTAKEAIMAEKRRENLIREAGWWLVRWDWADAWHADRLGARIRAAFSWRSPTLGSAHRPWMQDARNAS